MHSYALSHVTDEELLADLSALVATDRQTTAALLAHLAEVDARELFLPAACSSMHVYCVRVLRLAEEVAFKRIRAARAARRYPQIFDAIADGRLHVTGVVVLAPHLTDANVDEVLAVAAYRSKAELEMLVARLAPRPDVPAFIAPLDPQTSTPSVLQLDPDPVRTPPEQPPARVQAIAPERFALQCTISGETRAKLERLQALMSHTNPSGDLADVIDRACDALIEVVERERFAVTSRPRAKAARRESDDATYIPADVKRSVYERDGGRCTFTSTGGERCGERRFLQIDHVVPRALGGKPTVENLRLLCGPHNQHEADCKLGADYMDAKRAQAKANRPAPTPRLESDLVEALTSLGYKSAEAQRAVANTADSTPTTFEARLRAALASLSRSRPIRCSDGPFELAAGVPLWFALRDWRARSGR
jgi:5-methylcytosine-specific restriction endonuclease McrA